MLTRDQARAAFNQSGLTYIVLTQQSVQRLRSLINQQMARAGLMMDSFRCHQRGIVRERTGGQRWAEIRCKSFYFERREAVSFNPDGFIGFAGWAADDNVQPILAGFMAWVDEMKGGAA